MIKGILKEEARDWLAIFPDGVPLLSAVPETVDLVAEKLPRTKEEVFYLDVAALDHGTLHLVACEVIKQCGGGSPYDVMAAMRAGVKMPVRACLVKEVVRAAEAEVVVWRPKGGGGQG